MSMSYTQRLHRALSTHLDRYLDSSRTALLIDQLEVLGSCPSCGSSQREAYFTKDFFIHWQCKHCKLVYIDPCFSKDQFSSYYNCEANEIYNEQKFYGDSSVDNAINERNLQLLLRSLPNDLHQLRLLEIGPGNGYFSRRSAQLGFDTYAIELNQSLAKSLAGSGITVYSKDLSECGFPANYFDVIYLRDVIEHIPLPNLFMSDVTRILSPSGIVMFDTHNIFSIINLMTGPYHTVVFPFEHPVHWSKTSLVHLCSSHGLELKASYYDHSYQGIIDALSYLLFPSCTFIMPTSFFAGQKYLLRVFLKLLRFFRIDRLDRAIMHFLSNVTGRGSTMQLIFAKESRKMID